MAFCAACGSALKANANFCARCGKPATVAVPAPERAEPVAALTPPVASASITHRLLLALLSFGLAWALHTYLLVVVNDGFSKRSAAAGWINASGNLTSSVIVWAACSWLLWSFVQSVFGAGPGRTISSLMQGPSRLLQLARASTRSELGGLAVGAGLALLLGWALRLSPEAGLCLAGFWLLTSFYRPGALLARFFVKLSADPRRAQVMVAGLAPGFLLASLISSTVAVVVGVALVVLGLFQQAGGKPEGSGVAQASVVLLTVLSARFAFADDGGWTEAGGTLLGWWNSPGRTDALINGLIPALVAGIGALLPPIFGAPVHGLGEPTQVAGKPEKKPKPARGPCGPDEEYRCDKDPKGGGEGHHHHPVRNPDGTCTWYDCYIYACTCVNAKTGASRPAPDKHEIHYDMPVKTGPCPDKVPPAKPTVA